MTEQAAPSAADELDLLKERARTLGIPFTNNIRLDTLRQRVQSKLDGSADAAAGTDPEDDDGEVQAAPTAPAARRKTKAEIEQETPGSTHT